ncbi:alanine--glyoxylate aminotransferase family protein [Candidatus Venteria ishoeyi]|uniref:pyridoxal-phosphate-dependent aminotransferase family protein n=1 Tax=Candidatus Venteria ishoeyi TaxID=1899563 RepID=UPI0025A63AD7|nr:alanine--glyoxylate aminotransferase family protein [Candidatus Venteria ishoeyi]MDM8545886.1 alanine--glyoxylate aminotransferase family protein [Candidatus Venteria ishoeyi]
MSTHAFSPPQRTLMGPGPSDIHHRVLLAMAKPTIGHLDPLFIGMMEEIKSLLQMAFQTQNVLTLPISGPGSSGMEACFVNLLEPGDKVIICQNGVFGGRMKENALRCGAETIMVEDEWGKAIDLNKVEASLKQHPDAKALAFVHAETSTGVQSDARAIAGLAQKQGVMSIMDAVTSLAGTPVEIDEWGIDAVYSGTQKCLSCVPGLSPVSFNECAQSVISGRKTPVQSWFLDMNLVMGYWGSQSKRSYHHTAPVNSLYALHESLRMLEEEGLENAWSRHEQNHQALRAGLEVMGIQFVVDSTDRLPQLNAVAIPEGVDEAQVRSTLLNDYDLEIGAGLGPMAGKIWRIGLMGYASRKRNVLFCLNSLESVLLGQGLSLDAGVAVKAALAVYQ